MRFRMLNWEERNPRNDYKSTPWFRMDADFFRSKKLFKLSLNDKWSWACLLGLAAKENKGGLIEGEKEWVAKEIDVPPEHIVDLVQTLEAQGLLTTNVTCTSSVRETNKNSSLRNGTERNVTERITPALNRPDQLLEVWNANRGPLAEVKRLSRSRAAKIHSRFEEEPELTYWESVIKRLAASDFATGNVKSQNYPSGWKADFDWLIKNDSNHVKVAEGKYDNKSTKKSQTMKVFSEGDFA